MEETKTNHEGIIESTTNEDLLGPPKIDIIQVWLIWIWSMISGFIGSIVIVVSIFLFLLKAREFSWVYPYIYAITAFFATLFTSGLNIFMNKTINPDKYKQWSITFVQVFLVSIFLFIFFLPIYIYATAMYQTTLVYIFCLNVLLSILSGSIFNEVLSSYRYILLWIYWSFIWTLISILLTIIVLLTAQQSSQNLFVLIWLLILINTATNVFRALFEYVYYIYYTKTWMDQLWDIFYQIESEEKEIADKARKALERFDIS
jgi:hypothetical protein